MITVRRPADIYQAAGAIENGTFHGRWHFSFDQYSDREWMGFGSLRVFNDDTLSPGAVWPLHPHRNIEVVTYCAEGEFRHADENGKGGVLKEGWVQHTTVGSGMWHSEINNKRDVPMRFIQMWFIPARQNLRPALEQREVERPARTNKLLCLVSPTNRDALPIESGAEVFASFLEKGKRVGYAVAAGHGVYLYVVQGGGVEANENLLGALAAAKIVGEPE
jgi:hypothetical protein